MAQAHRSRLRNLLSEASGSVGDLGIILPLAFALVVTNGFPASRIFLLWGIVYFMTGMYYRVPVSVQPLKAMAIIAITVGFTPTLLASAAFFYGLLFIILSLTGAIRWLGRLFTPALVQGVQLGIGLMLAQKAVVLIRDSGLFLGGGQAGNGTLLVVTAATLLVLIVGQIVLHKPVAVFLLAAGLLAGILLKADTGTVTISSGTIQFTVPAWKSLGDIFLLLILPQLPLTLGNAVYAANDACHQFWPERSGRVTAGRLAASIGLSNLGIGLLGGFPVCHGAGGIAAHARFGGRSGLTTMITGAAFVTVALVSDWSTFLFLIPVPILGSLLLLTSWTLIRLCARLRGTEEWIVAVLVGGVAFTTHHLALALLAGLFTERLLAWRNTRKLYLYMPGNDGDTPKSCG